MGWREGTREGDVSKTSQRALDQQREGGPWDTDGTEERDRNGGTLTNFPNTDGIPGTPTLTKHPDPNPNPYGFPEPKVSWKFWEGRVS